MSASGSFQGPVATSPTVGVAGNPVTPLAFQNGCGPDASCDISLPNGIIASAVLQKANDGNHYLLTSFDFSDAQNQTTQSVFFVGKVENFSGTPVWNVAFADSSAASYGVPTIVMDKDLLITYTYTQFLPNAYPVPFWNTVRGLSPTNGAWPSVLASGTLAAATSLGKYTGNPSSSNQIWGDFVTTVWDPTIGTSRGGFWTVQEYSPGGPIESTEMVTLQDPAPYFVGYTVPPESECIAPNGALSNPCGLTFSAPAGAQPGDVLVAILLVGGKWGAWDPKQPTNPGLQVPSGWTLVPATYNNNTAPQLYSYTNSNDWTTYATTYLAVYQYQTNDPGSYEFIMHFGNTGGIILEIGGFLVSYRGASGNLLSYAANGWPAFQVSTSQTTGAMPPANGDNTLLTLFGGACIVPGLREETPYISFSAPTGFPPLAVETPFFDGGEIPFIAADVAFGASQQTFGPYSANSCNVLYGGQIWYGLIFAYSLPIPDGSGLPTSAGHPLFFAGEIPLPGQFFLNFADQKLFGYYDYTYWPGYLNHHDLGMEWYVDANDPSYGAWLNDSKLGWLYTNPADFPILWSQSEGDWWAYKPDPNNSGHYTTNPRWFWDYGNGGSIQPHWFSS